MAGQSDSGVAEKFLVGFAGTRLPPPVRALLPQGLAGVVLYSRNFTSPAGLRALTDEIRQAAGRAVLIGIDQEGGRRFALPEPFTTWPSATELGRLDSASAVEKVATALARELCAVGCNLDFAPMLDLALQPDSPVTRDRSFGADPHKVAQLGVAFLRGLRAGGALACAKHFPGHGDTIVDPHGDLPVFAATAQRLDSIELIPFAAAVDEGVPVVMTAHILLPTVDRTRPASLSRQMLSEVLRERMGFQGVILADDLGMGAIARTWGAGEAAVTTFQAGSDLALLCHDWSLVEPALETVAEALEDGRLSETEWQASQARIEWLRAAAQEAAGARPGLEVVGCAEHRALAAEIRARVAGVHES